MQHTLIIMDDTYSEYPPLIGLCSGVCTYTVLVTLPLCNYCHDASRQFWHSAMTTRSVGTFAACRIPAYRGLFGELYIGRTRITLASTHRRFFLYEDDVIALRLASLRSCLASKRSRASSGVNTTFFFRLGSSAMATAPVPGGGGGGPPELELAGTSAAGC